MTVWHGDCLEVMQGLPDSSVDAVVCDPPYGLGFMGREWDDLPPGLPWARECLRVLKPGGHLLAFGGSRTWHRLACAVEDAGFEVRDSIAWLYGSGFPKSLNVSKAIDKARDDDATHVTSFLRDARGSRPLGEAVRALGFDGSRGTHGVAAFFSDDPKNARVPSPAHWEALRYLYGFGPEMDAEVERLNARKGQGSDDWNARPLAEHEGRPGMAHSWRDGKGWTGTAARGGDPVRDAAQQWAGWGTALKPAFEPVVVARKPLAGTVAQTILAHGTGALNVDGCRVEANGERFGGGANGSSGFVDGYGKGSGFVTSTAGRWPTNVVLDGNAAEELDRQSGIGTTNRPSSRGAGGQNGAYSPIGAQGSLPYYGDSGGASRFFPVFRYQAKAPTRERVSYVKEGAGTGRVTGLGGKVRQCNVCETRAIEFGAKEPSCGHGDFRWEEPTVDTGSKVAHPTVKPLALMQWLVRLVTPPGGVVLEPFAGSGTTVEACLIEGFRCIAIEREADYLPLIEARIARQQKPDVPTAAEALALFDFEEPA